jgi:hypothetical protein
MNPTGLSTVQEQSRLAQAKKKATNGLYVPQTSVSAGANTMCRLPWHFKLKQRYVMGIIKQHLF